VITMFLGSDQMLAKMWKYLMDALLGLNVNYVNMECFQNERVFMVTTTNVELCMIHPRYKFKLST
jgi:hypothetical protein